MINKLNKVDEWCMILGLQKPSPQEIAYWYKEPIEIEEADICTAFNEFVAMCESRYSRSTYMPDYARLGLNCPIPEAALTFNEKIILGITTE